MSKICNSCGKEVEDSSNFCPYCKCETFRLKQEVMAPDNSIVHRLFYSYYDGYYVISKAKLAGISVFLIFLTMAFSPSFSPLAIFFAVVFGALTFMILYAIRKIIGKPNQVKLTHNDYGLFQDLKHFLFYWQNKEGGFAFSKTKAISHLVFLLFFLMAFTLNPPSLFAAIGFGLIFEIPVFVLGFGVHKLTNPNPEAKPQQIKTKKKPEIKAQPQVETTQKQIIPQYLQYVSKLDDLNAKFVQKDRATRRLIEKKFEPPQITYTRFIRGVDKSKELFNKHLESAMTMITLADEYSPRIASEIEAKIRILEAILSKLEALSNELVLNDNLNESKGVDNLIDEMDDLIGSVKDYE